MTVILNGKPLGFDQRVVRSISDGLAEQTMAVELNGKIVHGAIINGYSYPPVDSYCVVYFPGLPGQGGSIWDMSSEGNHGTIYGAGWRLEQNGLWSLSFDGSDDYVRVDYDANLEHTTKIGGFSWVRASSLSGTQPLLHRYFGANRIWGMQLYNAQYWMRWGKPADGSFHGYTYTGDVLGSAGVWYMLGFGFDGGTLNMFVDGESVSYSGTPPSSLWSAAIDLQIGLLGAQKFDGNMQLMRFYTGWAPSESYAHRLFEQERHLYGR